MSVPNQSRRIKLDSGPFGVLARLQVLGSAADGAVAVALAGSIFFAVQPGDARWRVALYLLLTIAPFAVVTPLIGPAIDRAKGGRRGMMLLTLGGRVVLAFLMIGRMDSLLLFPAAFGMLVMQKGYAVASRAVVPKLVDTERQLVEANSKLALLSALGSMSGAAVGAAAAFAFGASAGVFLAMVVFGVALVVAFGLPKTAVAVTPADAAETAELHAPGIVLAAQSMAVLRGLVGFLSFLVAFEFRGGKKGVDIEPLGAASGAASAVVRKIDVLGDPAAPAWHFGVVVAAAGIGALAGARIAPRLRKSVSEEQIILGVLALTAAAGLIAAWRHDLFGAALISFSVAVASGTGKLAFDSLVQREAPDANYGRSFAKFEARFQLWWAAGAFIPVVLAFPGWFGYLCIGLVSIAALANYQRAGRLPKRLVRLRRSEVSGAAMYDPSEAAGPTTDALEEFDVRDGEGGERGAAIANPIEPGLGFDPTISVGERRPGPHDPTLAEGSSPASSSSRPPAGLDPTLVAPSPSRRPASPPTAIDGPDPNGPGDEVASSRERPPSRSSNPRVDQWPDGVVISGGPGVEVDPPPSGRGRQRGGAPDPSPEAQDGRADAADGEIGQRRLWPED
jgi:MFS family permease